MLGRVTDGDDPALARDAKRGWWLWAVFAVVAAAVTWNAEASDGQVLHIYRVAAADWWHGRPVYRLDGTGFLYLPASAVLYGPFAALPMPWAGALWRIGNVLAFATGIRHMTLAVLGRRRPAALLVAALAFPLAWSCARHGQMTLTMAAALLLGLAAAAEGRWRRAGWWLCLAVAIKPLALVAVLLAFVLLPRLRPTLLVGLCAVAALPFATQAPGYVVQQYRDCVANFRAAAAHAHQSEQAQLFWSLRELGLGLEPATQTVIQLGAAAVTLALCWWACRRGTPRDALLRLYTFGVGYVLLLSPKTERNTYALLAPPLAILAAQARAAGRTRLLVTLVGIVLLFVASNPVGRLLTGGPTVWMKPLLCLVFLGVVVREAARDPGPAQ